ncbi:MAG TPA: flagellar hook-basal body complex protein FliE [Pseudaminobacter sp.]|jgi:flagellar hook-basal body complex protein FliE|nr:flagellar hook-basal body complex protein FliE [Pseudaminobacter sp.]
MISGVGAVLPQLQIGNTNDDGGLFPNAPAADAGASFAAMLTRAAGDAIGTLQQAEQVSVQALQGEADIRQVVDAVMSAEQSLQAAVAIRDKIVTAYLEVSRMAI